MMLEEEIARYRAFVEAVDVANRLFRSGAEAETRFVAMLSLAKRLCDKYGEDFMPYPTSSVYDIYCNRDEATMMGAFLTDIEEIAEEYKKLLKALEED